VQRVSGAFKPALRAVDWIRKRVNVSSDENAVFAFYEDGFAVHYVASAQNNLLF
jgi:hypothetical protein